VSCRIPVSCRTAVSGNVIIRGPSTAPWTAAAASRWWGSDPIG